MTVLVMGGGVTGLAAAHALSRRGVPVVLAESAPRLGGKILTERVDGFVIEHGPDAFMPRPATLALLRELGLADDVVRPRPPAVVFVWHRGRLVPIPPGFGLGVPTRFLPFARSSLFSPAEKLRAALDIVMPPGTLEGDEAIGAFLRRRVGDAVVDRLAGPLIGGIYGGRVDELSLLALMPRLRDAERRHRSLFLAGLAARRVIGGVAPVPVTLAGGMGTLVDALAVRLRDVDVRLGTSVTHVERASGAWVADLTDGTRVRADAVVLATPAPASAAILADVAPGVSRTLASMPHRSTIAVSLAYDASAFRLPLDGHGFLASEDPLPLAACTWTSAKWPGRAPAGSVLLRATIRDEALLSRSDAELVDVAHGTLATVLGAARGPLFARIARWPAIMPRYTVGHLGRVARAEAGIAECGGLMLAGSSFRGASVPDCVADGEAAAARALVALGHAA